VLDGGPAASTERGFPCLDGLRALAATAVVTTHVAFWTAHVTPDLLGRVFSRLDVGVAVFFVLSGFLLSRPVFLAGVERRPAPRPAAYLWRRALRILPAYWLTVAAAFLLLPGNRTSGALGWLRYLALLQAYDDRGFGEGLTHTWSLTTEVAFYVILPVAGAGLVWLARRRPDRPTPVLLALGVAAALGLVWIAWMRAGGLATAEQALWLPGFLGWFGAGMALAVLSVSDRTWRPVRLMHDLGSSLGTCWAAAGALFWIATSAVAGPQDLSQPTPAQAVTKSLLYLGIAGLVVLPLVFGDQRRGLVRRGLASPPARFLGEISYGLFLFHMVVLTAGYPAVGLRPFSGNLVLVFMGTWLIGAACATVVYVAVERPVRRWRGLVAASPGLGRRKAATTEASVTSARA
jgi:peptidoglycan/LPS O-acetylase OafA/YrhL